MNIPNLPWQIAYSVAIIILATAFFIWLRAPNKKDEEERKAKEKKKAEDEERLGDAVTLVRRHLGSWKYSGDDSYRIYDDGKLYISDEGEIRWDGYRVGQGGLYYDYHRGMWVKKNSLEEYGEWFNYLLKLANSCMEAEKRFQHIKPLCEEINDILPFTGRRYFSKGRLAVSVEDHIVKVLVDDEPVLHGYCNPHLGLRYLNVYRPGKWEENIKPLLREAVNERRKEDEAKAQTAEKTKKKAEARHKKNFSPIDDDNLF